MQVHWVYKENPFNMSRFSFLFQSEIATTQERMAFVNFKDLLGVVLQCMIFYVVYLVSEMYFILNRKN